MKSTLLPALLLFLLFSACTTIGDHEDDAIPSDVRSEIGVQKNKIIDAMRSGNRTAAEALCSAGLPEKSPDLFDEIGSHFIAGKIKNYPFVVTKEAYLKKLTAGQAATVSTGTGKHDFAVDFTTSTPESYVLIGYFDAPEAKYSALLIFGKYDTGWKINIFYLGRFEIGGKDIKTLSEDVKKQLEAGQFADAGMGAAGLRLLLKPGGDFIRYNSEAETKRLCDQVDQICKKELVFPVIIEGVENQPTVYAINYDTYEKELVPVIEYVTQLDLKDTPALEKECDAVHAAIGKTFPGIDLNNKNIFYKIWEKEVLTRPEDEESNFYGLMRKTKAH